MNGRAIVLRGDARNLPLPDESVDLIVTSPPYFGLRSYTDGGQHYEGQIGDELTPREYIDSLLDCTREWMRVLKPEGNIWVNLGDKYSLRAGQFGPQGKTGQRATRSQAITYADAPARRDLDYGVAAKSLLGLPWRYALACIDELRLILRAEVIWKKPNALPESVTDRVRRGHEQWFHLVKQPRYFSAVDEIREPHARDWTPGRNGGTRPKRAGRGTQYDGLAESSPNVLGALPGSVWEVATQPLRAPAKLGIDHFAAFPMEFPRRIIRGWSPPGICASCNQGRRPVVLRDRIADRPGRVQGRAVDALLGGHGADGRAGSRYAAVADIAGYACACPTPAAPTRPAVVLDPFGGTGTTALVASTLGRRGISIDRSADYCRIAQWRTADPGERARALGLPKPPPENPSQERLFEEIA